MSQRNLFDCAKDRPFNTSIAQDQSMFEAITLFDCSERRNSHCTCIGRFPTPHIGGRSWLPRDWAPFWQWDVPNDWQLIGAGGRLGIR